MDFIVNIFKKLHIKNFLMLTVSGIVNAFGITVFLAPVNLYDSGISGTSMLLDKLTPEYLSLSVLLLILNIPLFLYGLKKQGLLFTVFSIYTVGIYSLFAWLITDVFPIDVATASPFAGQDLLLCALFGGAISGIGSGLAIRFGGAMDGIEVMAVVFAKKIGITVGTFVMIYNLVIYVISGLITKSWVLPLYSIIAYAVALKMVDYIVEGFDREKCAIIVTVKPDDICAELSYAFGSGMTRVKSNGGYSNKENAMVYFVINRFQVTRMKDIVHKVDPSAYIMITEVADIFKNE